MSIFSKEQIKDAAKFSSFCQEMKLKIWGASIKINIGTTEEINGLPEEGVLDDIALYLYNKYIAKQE